MKKKFLKVYKAPGYPVDPKLQDSRNADRWINSLEKTLSYSRKLKREDFIDYERITKFNYSRRN